MILKEIRAEFPTYYGDTAEHDAGKAPEWGTPLKPVVITPESGLRIVLGTHEVEAQESPDIYIERRPGGWAIFLHPEHGDPVAMVYILDNGQTYVQREVGSDDRLTFLSKTAELPAELLAIPPSTLPIKEAE